MIKTEHLTKRYESLTAVDDVTFTVSPGEVLGFLGPNGAGKTTTMRMLAGFVTPTSGKASSACQSGQFGRAAIQRLASTASVSGFQPRREVIRRILAPQGPAWRGRRPRG